MKPLVPLTDEQQAVVATTRGPVRILAGAGTGKTTTIAHRIAAQVESGEFDTTQIVAVTFTRSAANEMSKRLHRLEIDGVRVGTFHAVAWGLVRARWEAWKGGELPATLPHKVELLTRCVPPGTLAWDILPDIEWLKRHRATPATAEGLLDSAARRTSLSHAETAKVLGRYERSKRNMNLVDFEDHLELCIQLLRGHGSSNEWFRESFRAFTVDEFQDVDPLQHELLVEWVGDSQEICVVGDSLQAIYGFRGGSHAYLEEFPGWQPQHQTFPLTTSFRSTSAVLDIANKFACTLPGEHLLLTSDAIGPSPVVQGQTSPAKETSALVAAISSLNDNGVSHSEMAILYRTNAHSTRFELALTRAGIPHQIINTPFLRRHHVLTAVEEVAGVDENERAAEALGERAAKVRTDAVTEDELSDADDLDVLVELWHEYCEAGGLHPSGFRMWLDAQTDPNTRGVVLSTYHRAKGLEFDAVFLPGLQQGTLPYYLALSPEAIRSERRLLYVGLTRARRHLHVSWAVSDGYKNPRSLFVEDLLAQTDSGGSERQEFRNRLGIPTGHSQTVRLSPPGQSMDALTSEVFGRAFTAGEFSFGRWVPVELSRSLPCPGCSAALQPARRPATADETPLFALICGECRDIYPATGIGESDDTLEALQQ